MLIGREGEEGDVRLAMVQEMLTPKISSWHRHRLVTRRLLSDCWRDPG